MGVVGYLEGTDPVILTKLASKGIDTLPLSNGADNHGKYIAHITPADNISLVIGYLHKFMLIKERKIRASDMLFTCKIHNIPIIVIVPREDHEGAREQLGDVADYVTLVDPENLMERILSLAK